MGTTTLWGFAAALLLIFGGGIVFRSRVVKGDVKDIQTFRRWTLYTAIGAAILVLLAALPVISMWPNHQGMRDISAVANAIGPLLLSVSVTLVSIFYSAGEWFETAQRFRLLGIVDAKPDRKGRQSERAKFWQDVLRNTKQRVVISGTTLGGWFNTGWEETRTNLLTILPHARVEVLLADPRGPAFNLRAEDPAEAKEAQKVERAGARAKRVYQRIGAILEDAEFSHHVKAGTLSFHTYRMTPLSVVWSDDTIFFTSYLPFVSDSACPEFTINRRGAMGGAITVAIEELLNNASRIQTKQQAEELGAACDNE